MTVSVVCALKVSFCTKQPARTAWSVKLEERYASTRMGSGLYSSMSDMHVWPMYTERLCCIIRLTPMGTGCTGDMGLHRP